jgi:uncharacterized Zn finger protein (UPF0148 family)
VTCDECGCVLIEFAPGLYTCPQCDVVDDFDDDELGIDPEERYDYE